MDETGVPRSTEEPGCKAGRARICAGKSGEAFTRNHAPESSPTATEDWVWGGIRPRRASRQLAQLQFHWGNPPPAAAPSSRIRITPSDYQPRLSNIHVSGAFATNLHHADLRLLPLLFDFRVFHCFNKLTRFSRVVHRNSKEASLLPADRLPSREHTRLVCDGRRLRRPLSFSNKLFDALARLSGVNRAFAAQ